MWWCSFSFFRTLVPRPTPGPTQPALVLSCTTHPKYYSAPTFFLSDVYLNGQSSPPFAATWSDKKSSLAAMFDLITVLTVLNFLLEKIRPASRSNRICLIWRTPGAIYHVIPWFSLLMYGKLCMCNFLIQWQIHAQVNTIVVFAQQIDSYNWWRPKTLVHLLSLITILWHLDIPCMFSNSKIWISSHQVYNLMSVCNLMHSNREDN